VIDSSGATVRAYAAAGCGAATCPPVWSVDLAGTVLGMAADAGGRLYALIRPSGNLELVVLDRSDGAVRWTAPLPGDVGYMTVAGGRVHVASGPTLSTFDGAGCGASTCGPQWTAALPGTATANPVSGGGVVYVAADNGAIVAYDAGGCGAPSCAPLVTLTVPGPPGGLVVSDGRLFVNRSDQTVTAFALPS